MIGVVGVKALENTPTIRGLLEPDLNGGLLASSVGIAVVVGVISVCGSFWFSRSPSGSTTPYISRRPALYIDHTEVAVVPAR